MKITKIQEPVHYAARIEAQVLDLDVNISWRVGLRGVWDTVGQYHYLVASQICEEAIACEYERPYEHYDT